jgi:predicted transcriptional regulator
MIIANGEEIKKKIQKMGFKLTEFADDAGIPYDKLVKALNNHHAAKEVKNALNKYGLDFQDKFPPKDKPKNRTRNAA